MEQTQERRRLSASPCHPPDPASAGPHPAGSDTLWTLLWLPAWPEGQAAGDGHTVGGVLTHAHRSEDGGRRAPGRGPPEEDPQKGARALSAKGSASRGTSGPSSTCPRPPGHPDDRAVGAPAGGQLPPRRGHQGPWPDRSGREQSLHDAGVRPSGKGSCEGRGRLTTQRERDAQGRSHFPDKATEAQRSTVTRPRPHILARRELDRGVPAAFPPSSRARRNRHSRHSPAPAGARPSSPFLLSPPGGHLRSTLQVQN